MDLQTLQQLAVSAGIGLLLGLERQSAGTPIAGIRTFPFIALFGTVCALVGKTAGGWIIAAGLLAVTTVLVMASGAQFKAGRRGAGTTTGLAVLLLYMLGALAVVGNLEVAIVVGGTAAVLLHWKRPMHRFVNAVGERDLHAIMHFALLSLIILPILPDRSFGPWGVWNPFKLWLMVVLITGISLAGYVAYKLFGAKAGTVLSGVIGGMISSTAATAALAKRTASDPSLAKLGALVIMIASCVSIARVLVEAAAVAPGIMKQAGPPLGAMLGACAVISGGMYLFSRNQEAKVPEQTNPAGFRTAFVFGALYAVILVAVAAGKQYFGAGGLYAVGAVSGLVNVDAITLSSAEMARNGHIDASSAWRVMLVAVMANFVFKLGLVAFSGGRALLGWSAAAVAMALASGGAILWLWPG